MSVRVLIVDDEAPARRKLAAHLAREPNATLVGEAASGPEAVEAIRSFAPDLVFLDVQMPGMTGLEVIDAIGVEEMPAVVFVTAYDEFALEAFEVKAVDYLLKPYNEERFTKAFRRAVERIAAGKGDAARLAGLLAATLPKRPAQRLLTRDGERLLFVNVREIVRLSADGNYVTVRTATASYQLRETLSSLEKRLDPERFARVHRSEIVNIDLVKEIQPFFHGDYVVTMKNGDEVRLSRRYQDRLLK